MKISEQEYRNVINKISKTIQSIEFDLSISACQNLKQSQIYSSYLSDNKITKHDPLTHFYLFLKTLIKLAISYIILIRNKTPKSTFKTNKIILIDIYIIPSMVKNKLFIDRYYNEFKNFLPPEKAKRCFYLPTLEGRFTPRSLINANYISREQFLSPSDYLYALTYFIRLKRCIKKIRKLKWLNKELKRNIITELNNNSFNYSTIYSLLTLRFAKKLSQTNIEIELLINWNENQVKDKALNKAFSLYFPKTYRKGYLGYYSDIPNNMQLIPTNYETEQAYSPDEFVAIGEYQKSTYMNLLRNIQVKLGPALRFTHLNSVVKHSESNIVLVGLPICSEDSDFIVDLVEKVSRHMPQLDFLIKPHPSSKRNYTFKGRNLHQAFSSTNNLLNSSMILITFNSSLCLEGIMKPIGVILVSKSTENFFYEALPTKYKGKIWNHAKSENELEINIRKISSYIKKNPNTLSRFRSEYISNYFIPPNFENVNSFFSSK